MLGGHPDQVVGFLQGRRHGLFEEHVPPGFERRPGHRVVVDGGHRHGDGLDLGQERAGVGEGAAAVARRHLLRPLRVAVVDAHQPGLRNLGVDPGVMLAHGAHPDDSHRDGHAGASIPHTATRSRSASARNFGRSITSVLPASRARRW